MLPTRQSRGYATSPAIRSLPTTTSATAAAVPDYYAEKRRHATLLVVNGLVFFVIAIVCLALMWSVFHALENYNKYYNNNAKLNSDAIALIRLRCQPQAMTATSVFAAADNGALAPSGDVLHPELHAAKQKMDSLYDIRNQQMLEADKALNDVCIKAREHANMDVARTSKMQAVAELLHHLWPLNWFGCTPGDQANSCHYAIFTSLSYLTHSAASTLPSSATAAGGGGGMNKVDVFSTPLQMINDLVRMVALGIMIGTMIVVVILMFCQRTAAYAIQIGTLSLLVLIVGSSLIWNAVLTLWMMVKLVAGCVLFVMLLMGPGLGLLKFVASTKVVKNLEERWRASSADKSKRNVSVQQTVQEHAATDVTGLFSDVIEQTQQRVESLFPNAMHDWVTFSAAATQQLEGSKHRYNTMPAISSSSSKPKAA